MKELDQIVLIGDLPDHALADGDVGTVVHAHRGGSGFEVEFVTLTGDTVAVVSLAASRVRAASPREIANARQVASV
ncbi:MAG: DUF4926 domain-containing protein [Deltaproteobacteria bacterium]|jgi:hypothetical protein|nr:DUF4926 domain-containing protein [Deltaproteobacteria bacterium]